jgi:ribosomal protein L31E
MATTKTMIWITTQFEGFHKYPKAPETVEFLRKLHRHIFHVKVWIDVKHNDRELEFILFKRFVDKIIKKTNLHIDSSCEMMCDILYNNIIQRYPKREVRIEVSEDGENGAYKVYSM